MLILLTTLSGSEEKEAHQVWCHTWHAVGAQTMETIISNVNQPPQVTSLQNLSP